MTMNDMLERTSVRSDAAHGLESDKCRLGMGMEWLSRRMDRHGMIGDNANDNILR